MLDPESFMKNSPFQLSKGESYNLENTTPELLKFQLQEQSRSLPVSTHVLQPLFIEASFNNHLQNLVDEKSITVDDDNDKNDEFLRADDMSGFSTPSSDVSDSWTSISGLSASNYMNLKILIENSVFDTSKMSPRSVLSLSKLKKLKEQIVNKKEQRDYLAEKFNISNQLCNTLLLNSKNSTTSVDSDLLYKVYKQTADLQLQLTRASREIDDLDSTLKSHYLTCLILGYIEDVKLTNITAENIFAKGDLARESREIQKAFDTLFAHIASLAAQKNVALPEYPENTNNEALQTKIDWVTNCIDKVMESSSNFASSTPSRAEFDSAPSLAEDSIVRDHSFLSASPYKAYKNETTLQKAISEYKLALNDLRFSHQYFMKEYEYLKENSLKAIADYRKKNSILEKELKLRSNAAGPADQGQRIMIESKNREISRLRKEVNLLRIECMGSHSPRNSTQINTSLLSNLEDDDAAERSYSTVSSPTMNNSGRQSMSNAILRKEFKKIVADIQDQHDMELENERKKSTELQEKLDKLNIR